MMVARTLVALSFATMLASPALAASDFTYLRCAGQLAIGENGEKVEPFDKMFRFSQRPSGFAEYWPEQREFHDFCEDREHCWVTVEPNRISVLYSWDAPKDANYTHSNLQLGIDRYTGVMWQTVEDVDSAFSGRSGKVSLISRTDAKCVKIDNPVTAQALF